MLSNITFSYSEVIKLIMHFSEIHYKICYKISNLMYLKKDSALFASGIFN